MEVMETRDYELIAELNKYVHDLHYNLYPDLFKPYDFEKMKAFFQPLVHNENYIFLLQKEGQHAIGYAWIEIRDYPESPFKKPYQSVYIHQLSIKESEQNKGYGMQLMEKIYKIAQAKGITLIELDYWNENQAAKKFYERQGFSKRREFAFREV